MHSLVSDACSDTGKKWILQVPKEIDEIIIPGVELAFNLEMCDSTGEDMGKPDADFVQEIQKYKNNITGIKVALCHDSYDYLLKEDFYFKHLEKIDIELVECKSKNCQNEHKNFVREACINFISRYANQLQHLEITDLHDWDFDPATNSNDLPHLPNMKSLSLQRSGDGQASFVMESVNFENVTKLVLYSFYTPNIDIEHLNIRNLSDLSLCDVDEHWSARLLKDNSSTLTKLVIDFCIMDKYEIDFKDIKFSKLKHLRIGHLYETDALTLIENSKNTLEEIYLRVSHLEHKTLESVRSLQLPCLKKVHLENLDRMASSKLVSSLISACNDNTNILIHNKEINKSLLELIRDNFMNPRPWLNT